MANNNSGNNSFWSIIGIILFLVFTYISMQTPSSKSQHEHNNGYDIHVGGE